MSETEKKKQISIDTPLNLHKFTCKISNLHSPFLHPSAHRIFRKFILQWAKGAGIGPLIIVDYPYTILILKRTNRLTIVYLIVCIEYML